MPFCRLKNFSPDHLSIRVSVSNQEEMICPLSRVVVDNFYLIEEQVQEIKETLSRKDAPD